jgi:predicted O-methyltransferase YrrM
VIASLREFARERSSFQGFVREYQTARQGGSVQAPGLNLTCNRLSGFRSHRNLSLGSYLRAVRNSPVKSQIPTVRKLFPYLFGKIEKSVPEICEFDSLKNYEMNYRRLAQFLGGCERVPPLGEVEFLRSIQNRGTHPGTIGLREFLFLTAFVSIVAPQRAIEIGTLAGFSAAVIAAALHRRHPDRKGIFVDTIDRNTHSVVDADKPVGFQISDIIPHLPGAVRVHAPADSSIVRELAGRDELELVFIDADHQHPRPLLDLLRIAPHIQCGGWILLHDITLGSKGVAAKKRFGAEWLFAEWPFGKISSANIGAVQMPGEKTAIIPMALRLMKLPFEMSVASHRKIRRALYGSVAELLWSGQSPYLRSD